jgi:DNA repair exonuclease SbcCD ATPase subunit
MEKEQIPFEEQEKAEKKGGALVIVLFVIIGILAGLSGYLAFQLNEQKDLSSQLLSERERAAKDIDEYRLQLELLTTKYDSLINIHEGLRLELEEERSKVIKLMSEYDALKSSGAVGFGGSGSQNMRSRLEELQQRYDESESIIQQLKAKNQELTAENFKNQRKLEEVSTENTKLAEDNTKLNKIAEVAKRLKTYEIYADAVRLTSGGKKEKQTDKAKKADRIRVCFTVLENIIADKGEKSLYVVIKTPAGTTYSDGDRSKITLLSGDEIAYSVKKDIFYDNKNMQLCMNWELKDKAEPGTYKVELYAEGVQIGKESFDLK